MFSKDKIKMEKMLRIQCCCLLCRLPTFGLGGPVTQRDEVVMYKVVTLLAKEEKGRRLIEQTPVKSSGIYWVLTKETRFPLWGKMESKISRLLTSNNLLVCFLLRWRIVGGVSSVTSAIVRHYSIKCAVTAVENKGNARNGFECVHPTSFKY